MSFQTPNPNPSYYYSEMTHQQEYNAFDLRTYGNELIPYCSLSQMSQEDRAELKILRIAVLGDQEGKLNHLKAS